jgi:TP901 family phage tail tape measure protein
MGLRTVTLEKGLRSLENRMRKFGSEMATMGTKIATAGAISLIPAALGTREFGEFDNQIRAVEGIAERGSKSIEQLSSKFQELGRTTKFTAVQVATAGKELAKGGFNTDLIDASIEGVLTLAQATETELPVAADMVSKLLNSFKVPKTLPEITKFVDQLVLTVNRSPQALGDLFESLKNFAPLGKNLGQSTESLLAFNAALAKVGLTGTLSGTQIRRVFVNIAKVEKKALLLKETGINIDEIFAGGGDVLDVLGELSSWFDATNPSILKTTGLLNEIFEVRGQVAATAFLQDLGKVAKVAKTDLKSFINELKNANGFAKKVSDTMAKGLGNQFLKLVSAISGVGIKIGEALKRPLTKIIGFISDNLEVMSKWIKKNQKFVVDYAKVGATILAVGAAMLAVGGSALFLSAVLGSIASLASMIIAPVVLLMTVLSKLAVVSSIVYAKIARFSVVTGRMLGPLKLGSKLVKTLTLSFKGLQLVLNPVYKGVKLILRGLVALAGIGVAPILKNFPKILSYVLGMAARMGSAWAVSGFLPILVQIQALLEAFGLLKMGATAAGNGLVTLFGNIGASAFQATLRVKKAFIDLHLSMMPFLTEMERVKNEVVDVFLDLQKKLSKNKRTKATALLDELIKSFGKVFSILKGSAGKGFSSLFASIGSGLASFKKSIGEGFSYIAKQLAKLGPTLKSAKAWFTGLFKGFQIGRVMVGVLAVAKSFILWEIAFRTVGALFNGLVAVVNEASGAFSGFGEQASSAGSAMAKAFAAGQYIEVFNILWVTVENFFVRASVAFNNLYEIGVSSFNRIRDNVVAVFTVISDAFKPLIDAIVAGFKWVTKTIGEALGFDMSDSFGKALGDSDDFFTAFAGHLAVIRSMLKKTGSEVANLANKGAITAKYGFQKFDEESAYEAVRESDTRNPRGEASKADKRSELGRTLQASAAQGDSFDDALTDEVLQSIKDMGIGVGSLDQLKEWAKVNAEDLSDFAGQYNMWVQTTLKENLEKKSQSLIGTYKTKFFRAEADNLLKRTNEGIDQEEIFNAKDKWDAKQKANKEREAATRKSGEERIEKADEKSDTTVAKVSFKRLFDGVTSVVTEVGSAAAKPFVNQANALAGGNIAEFGSKVADKFSKKSVQKSMWDTIMSPVKAITEAGPISFGNDLMSQFLKPKSEQNIWETLMKPVDALMNSDPPAPKAARKKRDKRIGAAVADTFKVTDSVAGARGFNASAVAAASRGGKAQDIKEVTEEIAQNTKKTNTVLEQLQKMLGIA